MNKTSLLAIALLWAVAFPLQATARTKPKPKHQNPQVLKQSEVFKLAPWTIEPSSFDTTEPEIKKFKVKDRPEILESLQQVQGSEFVGDRQIERVLSGLKKPQTVAKGKTTKKLAHKPRFIARRLKQRPNPLPATAPETIPTSLSAVAVSEQTPKPPPQYPRRRPLAWRSKPHAKPATQTPADFTAPIPVPKPAPIRVRSNIEPPPPISLGEQANTGIEVAIAHKLIDPESAFTLRLRAAARLLSTQSIFEVSTQTGIQPNVLQRIVDLGYKASRGTYAATPSTETQQTPLIPNTKGTNTQPAQAARYVENAPQSRSVRRSDNRHHRKPNPTLLGD